MHYATDAGNLNFKLEAHFLQPVTNCKPEQK